MSGRWDGNRKLFILPRLKNPQTINWKTSYQKQTAQQHKKTKYSWLFQLTNPMCCLQGHAGNTTARGLLRIRAGKQSLRYKRGGLPIISVFV